MKNFRFSLLIIILCLTYWTIPVAQAHFIVSDRDIKIVTHIVPNDDPIVGQPATFFFEISDKQRRFEASMCDCQVRIMRDGAELYSRQLFQDHQNVLGSPAFTFTFPERAVYDVIVSGASSHADAFPSFLAEFQVRVDKTAGSGGFNHGHGLIAHSLNDLLSLIIVGAAVAYLLIKEYS